MSFSYEYLVQFRDTDAAGVVYFANILSICHVVYEASLIGAGINLQLFVDNPNFAVPIIHVSADFYKPLFCGDRVIIELTPRSIDIHRFEIKYQILSNNLSVLATAITKHIVIDPQTRKRKELPEALNNWLIQWGEN
ncbi:MAG: acyl-CoA thioesterase [Chamaesiphon sp.]|nr:acyl-CoA thioesterase [Chamaesiphon sp.]